MNCLPEDLRIAKCAYLSINLFKTKTKEQRLIEFETSRIIIVKYLKN